MSVWAKLGHYDETRELLGRLKVWELEKLARQNDIALQKEDSLGEVRPVKSKEEIIDVLIDSEFKESSMVELLGLSRLTKEELLNYMNLRQLRGLARESGILLQKTSFLRTKKATKKEDIIDVLKVLTTSKVRDYAEKITLIKKPPRKRVKKAEVVKARARKRTRSTKVKERTKSTRKDREKERVTRSRTPTQSSIRKKPITRKEDQKRKVVKTPAKHITRREVMIEEEAIREKIIEREIVRRQIPLGIDENKVLKVLRYTPFVHSKRERGYETQLSQRLSTKGYPIEHERPGEGSGFNLVLGENDIAVEVKTVKDVSVFNGLLGKIYRHKDQFRKVFIIIIDELQDPSIMRREAKRIKQIDPEKIKVIVKKPKKR